MKEEPPAFYAGECQLLIHHILGLQEETVDRITISPMLPQALRRQGASYLIEALPWGNLSVECLVKDEKQYKIRLRWRTRPTRDSLINTPDSMPPHEEVQQEEWEGQWGEKRSLRLLPA
jgi:hypothetical protein